MSQYSDKVICKICGKEFLRISPTHLKIHNTTLTEYKAKFNLTKYDLTSKTMCASTGFTKDKAIKKYGEIEGCQKWNTYCEKQKNTNTFEYKKNKYGWTEDKFREYNLKRAATLENFILRHGKINGVLKWDQYKERQKYAGVALEYFIEKHGPIKGPYIFKEINKKKSNSLENYIKKYGTVEGKIKWKTRYEDKKIHFSKTSQELFSEVQLFLPSHDLSYYAKYNSEYFFYDKNKKKHIFVDCYDKTSNKCIEYFRDYWHANPSIYEDTFKPRKDGPLAKDIWNTDKDRIRFLEEEMKIKTLIIWESDFLSDRKQTILKCVEFLNEN